MDPVRLGARAVLVGPVGGVLGLLRWEEARHAGPAGVAREEGQGRERPGPDLPPRRLDGDGTLALAAFDGKPRVVNFWASWCGPCRDEAPLLQNAALEYRGRVVVLGVDYQDFTGDARKFVRKFGLTYPIGRDGNGSLLARW